MGIGIRIKTILHDKKMTIKQLSELSGVSLNTLYSITKRDSDNIDPVILRKISSALGVDQDELSGRLVIFESSVGFENDDGIYYNFDGGTYLAKVASISNGLKDSRDYWLSLGDICLDLDEDGKKQLVMYGKFLVDSSKNEKPPQE